LVIPASADILPIKSDLFIFWIIWLLVDWVKSMKLFEITKPSARMECKKIIHFSLTNYNLATTSRTQLADLQQYARFHRNLIYSKLFLIYDKNPHEKLTFLEVFRGFLLDFFPQKVGVHWD